MELSKNQKGILALASLAFVAVAAVAGYLLLSGWDLRELIRSTQQALNHFLTQIPTPLYWCAFVILPAFGVPLSVFYLTAIPVLGTESTFLGLALGILAVAGNIIFTRLLTHGIFSPVLRKILAKRDLKIPVISRQSELKIVLALRCSPIPFVFQNYLLALAHSHWRYYLGLSILVQGAIGSGMMLVGNSLFSGGLGYALLGVFLILIVSLALQWYRNRNSLETK